MKLRRVALENVRSFLDKAELKVDGDISIIIAPNGGGKTNLLDAVVRMLRRHLLASMTARPYPTQDNPKRHEFQLNDMLDGIQLEPHSLGIGKPQLVEFELEVTQRDIANMLQIQSSANEIADKTERDFGGASLRSANSWDLTSIKAGDRYTYQIRNNALQSTGEANSTVYRQYLALYEVDAWLRGELGISNLSMPMLSLPVNRASGGLTSSVSLANYNDHDYKRGVDAASSRTGSSIIALAVGRIAKKFRLLEAKDDGKANQEFYGDPSIQLLSSVLQSLGYSWKLICTNALSNNYDIELEKQGSKFLVSAASSGEKELLTYLFAIYALNVRDALIVVDEPELHLHPRWQRKLLALFERLSIETGNQFLLATHSPVFVSPSSIQYISRIYSANQKSAITRLSGNQLPDPKHLFSIINSQNNEQMFFADKVVLVEGISDRIFFEALFNKLGVISGSTRTCEIISVGGKGFFRAYEDVLNACAVPYAVIADQDYLCQISTAQIKGFFTINNQDIKNDVIDNIKSLDADALIKRFDDAINNNEISDLKLLWEYIKSRRIKLIDHLNAEQKAIIDAFLIEKRQENIFVLSRGDLETYLPTGFRSKQLDKLISLIQSDFFDSLPDFSKTELTVIANKIKEL